MKRTALAAFAVLAVVLFLAGGADAFPGYSQQCTDCHDADNAVTLTAADQGCTGNNASYRLTISTPHNWKEAWAVLDSAGSNVNNGTTFPATVSLASGSTYTIYGVTNKPGQPGTDFVTVTPSCAPPPPPPPPKPSCTDGDNDGYFAEAGCQGSTDCNDGDEAINPGAAEVCGDGIDNNCGGGIDEGCKAPAVDTTIDIIDEFGAVIASEVAGDSGKATFYDVPAGTYFLEMTQGDSHFARLQFLVSDQKSPARVIAKVETEDEDDEASLEVEVDIYSMSDSEKVAVKKLGGSIKWDLDWAGSNEDFVVSVIGNGVVNLDRVTLETRHGSLNAYRIEVTDKRHHAEALFKKSDLIGTLVPADAEEGDRLPGRLYLVTPANEKVYRFKAQLKD